MKYTKEQLKKLLRPGVGVYIRCTDSKIMSCCAMDGFVGDLFEKLYETENFSNYLVPIPCIITCLGHEVLDANKFVMNELPRYMPHLVSLGKTRRPWPEQEVWMYKFLHGEKILAVELSMLMDMASGDIPVTMKIGAYST